jgi:hypothetical protein
MYKYFLLVVCTFCVFVSNAQNDSGIEDQIRDLEQLAVKGILSSDTNILKQVWAPEFMVNTPRNDIAENREAVFRNQKAGLINYSSFERIIEKMEVQENIVITMGYETFVSKNDIPGAKAGQIVKRRFTDVWMKKDGRWLQIARHASIICP